MDPYTQKLVEDYLVVSGYSEFIGLEDMILENSRRFRSGELMNFPRNNNINLMCRGYCDVYYPDKYGKNHLITRIYSSDYQFMGIISYHFDGDTGYEDYFVSYSKDSIVLKVKDESVKRLIENPKFLYLLLKRAGHQGWKAAQENYLRNVFSFIEFLAYILYNYSSDDVFKVDSYTTLASLLKCNRTNLYRALDELESMGLIEKTRNSIKVKSLEGLKYLYEEKI